MNASFMTWEMAGVYSLREMSGLQTECCAGIEANPNRLECRAQKTRTIKKPRQAAWFVGRRCTKDMKSMNSGLCALVTIITITLGFAAAPARGETEPATSIIKRINRQLVTLPFYGVFDNLGFKVEGDTVTLSGQAVRPSTRKDAERRVAKIEGVERVINNI